jgi:alpha-beta hydrolase superfamily lysophospholipase
MVWAILHDVLVGLYIAAPAVALVVDAIVSRKAQRAAPSGTFIAMTCTGIVLGAGLGTLYAFAVHGGVRYGQLALAAYFATSLLLILRIFDLGLQRLLALILRVNQPPEKPTIAFRSRVLLASLTRVVVLFGIGLPYVMASVMTYRPKVDLLNNPQQQLGFDFAPVSFTATDDTMLSAWWIPAENLRGREISSDKTVLICHGLASNKANELSMARAFVPHGYNVLIFDFRAHGESGGQLTSYGDLERRDVLGAVRYLREHHADESHHIYGVGESMGAAALIAAAADPSPEGQAIDAIAAYGAYDTVQAEMQFVTNDRFISPLRWVLDRFGLPLASAQVGANLGTFSPATLVQAIWPRPILIIHGVDDRIISFERGRRLFESAGQPKERIWVDHAGHNDLIHDPHIADMVRQFFEQSHSTPII